MVDLTLADLKEIRKNLKFMPSKRKLTRKYDWDEEQYKFICKWAKGAFDRLGVKIVTDQYQKEIDEWKKGNPNMKSKN